MALQDILHNFVERVRTGVAVPGGGPSPNGTLVSGWVDLDPTDADAITAAAFDLGVIDPADTSWADAKDAVVRVLGDG